MSGGSTVMQDVDAEGHEESNEDWKMKEGPIEGEKSKKT